LLAIEVNEKLLAIALRSRFGAVGKLATGKILLMINPLPILDKAPFPDFAPSAK
jgi:hypothetical protein